MRLRIGYASAGLLTLSAAILCWTARPLAASDADLNRWADRISAAVQPERSMELVRKIWETDRWSTFPKYAETARNLSRAMEDAGLRQVEIVNTPADGETQFGYWTMPLAWDVRRARLEIVEPEADPEFRVLADFLQTPASLGMWSGSTPPGGIEVETADVGGKSAETIAAMDLSGKLAMTSKNPAGLKWALVEAGAAGAINAFTENEALVDDRQWINAWGDAGWAYTKASTPLLSFSITPRQAAYLRSLLRDHGRVVVRAEVDARYYEGDYPYVTGVVPGSDDGGEEVLTIGHMSEQGAHDNATGVAAMVEALAVIRRLIENGELARPKRTIRMLAVGELYGTMHYVTQNPQRIQRTVGAICLDTPAGPYEIAGTEYAFHINPDVARSYTDSLIARVAAAYFDRKQTPRPWRLAPYRAGTDNFLGEPAIGTPTVWPYAGSGVHSHHNTADTPDTVDPRSLRDLAVVAATYLYALAAADYDQALWLAEVGLTRGYEGVLESFEKAFQSMTAADSGESLGRELDRGLRLISYREGRERQAIESATRLAPRPRRADLRRAIAPLTARLKEFSDAQRNRLRATADRHGRRLGLSAEVEPIRAVDPRAAEAAKIVVRRKRPGTITFDDLPVPQRNGYPSGAWWGPQVAALFWCDGERNLAEVIELTELELGPSEFDFVGYFRFLERKGYVEFVR